MNYAPLTARPGENCAASRANKKENRVTLAIIKLVICAILLALIAYYGSRWFDRF